MFRDCPSVSEYILIGDPRRTGDPWATWGVVHPATPSLPLTADSNHMGDITPSYRPMGTPSSSRDIGDFVAEREFKRIAAATATATSAVMQSATGLAPYLQDGFARHCLDLSQYQFCRWSWYGNLTGGSQTVSFKRSRPPEMSMHAPSSSTSAATATLGGPEKGKGTTTFLLPSLANYQIDIKSLNDDAIHQFE